MQADEYIHGGAQKSVYTAEETCTWPCPLCGGDSDEQIKVEYGALGVVSCRGCGLIRTNPRLKSPDAVYRGNQAIYEEEFRLVRSGKAPHHRDVNYEHDLKLISSYKPTGNFLDVGTNAGSFLRMARGKGWQLTGVEPSPVLAELAHKWWGLEIVQSFLEKAPLPEHHYDVVTMTDVFEHIVNPREVLTVIRRVIKPDGILFVKVPNGRFSRLKHKGRQFLGRPGTHDFDSYEHVVHYTDETLREMLKVSGFTALKLFADPPVQIPVWHRYVGHYYQHKSPFALDWKTYSARRVLYWAALAEASLTGRPKWLAPNLTCVATPASS